MASKSSAEPGSCSSQNLTVAKLDGLHVSLPAAHPGVTFTTDFTGADVAGPLGEVNVDKETSMDGRA